MESRYILTVVFLTAGFLVLLVSTVGVVRMRDMYSRLHAAGVGGSLGLMLAGVGLVIYEGIGTTSGKVLLVTLAVFITNPIATHIVAKVAYRESLPAQEGAVTVKKDAAAAQSGKAGGPSAGNTSVQTDTLAGPSDSLAAGDVTAGRGPSDSSPAGDVTTRNGVPDSSPAGDKPAQGATPEDRTAACGPSAGDTSAQDGAPEGLVPQEAPLRGERG